MGPPGVCAGLYPLGVKSSAWATLDVIHETFAPVSTFAVNGRHLESSSESMGRARKIVICMTLLEILPLKEAT